MEPIKCIFGYDTECTPSFIKLDTENKEYRTCGMCVSYHNLFGIPKDPEKTNIYCSEKNMAVGVLIKDFNRIQCEITAKVEEIKRMAVTAKTSKDYAINVLLDFVPLENIVIGKK
ncbi:MAG: hypothetical protein KJ697_02185 [Nanoarchaeota archaeon]|nr:hypothetical protein [Nanoarchaeota archaeon]MBU4124075.1 hypothetical protein [Nanoarchaeota archaeon]